MPQPPPRRETIRQAIQSVLELGDAWTLRELSQEVGVPEKSIPGHLKHLDRSLRHEDKRIELVGPECLDCGFVFRERTRFKRPGRCPECRSTHLSEPRFRIA